MYKTSLFILLSIVTLFGYEESDLQALIEYRDQRKENIETVIEKIDQEFDQLRKSNPKYNYQDSFESDEQYLARMQSVVGELREAKIQIEKKYKLEELREELHKLYNKEYLNDDFTIIWDKEKYNPNTQSWPVIIEHERYGYNFQKDLTLSREHAKAIYDDQARMKVEGVFDISYTGHPDLLSFKLIDNKSEFSKEWRIKEYYKQCYTLSNLSQMHFLKQASDNYYLGYVRNSISSSDPNFSGYFDLKTGVNVYLMKIINQQFSISPSGNFFACITSYKSRSKNKDVWMESDKGFRLEIRDFKTKIIVYKKDIDVENIQFCFNPFVEFDRNDRLYFLCDDYLECYALKNHKFVEISKKTFKGEKTGSSNCLVEHLILSLDSKTYSLKVDGKRFIFDASTHKILSPQIKYTPYNIAYSPDSKFIFVPDYYRNDIVVISIPNFEMQSFSFNLERPKVVGVDKNGVLWCVSNNTYELVFLSTSISLQVTELDRYTLRSRHMHIEQLLVGRYLLGYNSKSETTIGGLCKMIAPYDSLVATLPQKVDVSEISNNGASILNEKVNIGNASVILEIAGQDTNAIYSTYNTLLDFKTFEPFLYIVEQDASSTLVKKMNLENKEQEIFPLTTDYVSSFVYGNGESLIVQGDLTNQIIGEINKSILGKILSALPKDHKMLVFNKTFKILINDIEKELFINKIDSSGTIARKALVDFVRSHDIDLQFSNDGKLTAMLTSRDDNTSQLFIWNNTATQGELAFETDQAISQYTLKGDSLYYSSKNGENYYLKIQNLESNETLFSEYFSFDPNINHIEFNPQNSNFISTFKISSGMEYFKIYHSRYDFDVFRNDEKHCCKPTWSKDGKSCYFILDSK